MHLTESYSPITEHIEWSGLQPFVQPLHTNLEEDLLEGAEPGRTALVLAICAGYAYSDAKTLARTLAGLGLQSGRLLAMEEKVDAMSIWSTGYLIQSGTGRLAVLCYRGTEPLNLNTWLTDIDVSAQKFPFRSDSGAPDAFVHGGFYRNVEGTFPTLVDALQLAVRGSSILPEEHDAALKPMERLYVTGHSLGGAMAVMAAAMLAEDMTWAGDRDSPARARPLDVYTFGQPMVGDAAFAERCAKLNLILHRYVHGYDIVPRLPSADVVGGFQHFGQPTFLDGSSQANHAPPEMEEAQKILAGIVGHILVTGLRATGANILESLPGRQIAELPVTAVRGAAHAIRHRLMNRADRARRMMVSPDGRSARVELAEKWPPQAPTILDVLIAADASLVERLKSSDAKRFYCSLTDHAPNLYIDALRSLDGEITGERFRIDFERTSS
ncbi:hypothetical protein ACFY20_30095 [Streptomyces sp. NPDC001312]|uniref:lipase family protein n=1 Tax=Streptomyces sp. NPDC001312 TaxID=3364561 RepID=UPI0036BC68BF